MLQSDSFASRRRFLTRVSLGATAAFVAGNGPFARGALAEALIRTPRQTEGPFYPDHLPLDTDNDLIIVNDKLTPAVGEITHLTGRILDGSGSPIRNALVEIWQCDANGAYLHSGTGNAAKRDGNFQGFGRFLTGSSGEYYFRTIKPVAYPGRTPHIHFKIKLKGQDDPFTTQCYIKGHPQNARDGVLRGIRDDKQRDSVQVDFSPIEDSKAKELAAKFDVVMGSRRRREVVMGRLTYATPPRAKPWIDEAARECVRRGAQHAAALAGVFFAGGCVAVKTMVRLNGVYGDEFFAMLLFLVSFVSLAVWFVLFTIWLIATIAARKRKRTLAATAAWQSTPPENPAP